MSLQELDTAMAKPLTPVGAETENRAPLAKADRSNVDWLRREHPQFFTDKIVQNRTAKLPAEKAPSRKTWELIRRKLGANQKTNVALHKNTKDGTFYFKFPSDDTTRMPIGRDILVIAIAAVKGSEWVQMKAGGHTLCLHRSELRIAFKKLDA